MNQIMCTKHPCWKCNCTGVNELAGIRTIVIALSMVVLTILASTDDASAVTTRRPVSSTASKHLTILMLNDVYQEAPVDKGQRGGFARVATLRKEVMSKQPNTLFLFAGDTISPSVASRTFRGRQMIAAWNAIGLDYAVPGNHEFDFGPNVFLERIADSKFKWICANIIDKTTGKLWAGLDPYVIREVDGIRVGIFGLLTPDTLHSSRTGPMIDILDPCAVAKRIVPEMRAKGAQIIIALTHLTIFQDKELAHCAPIDLIVGGHEHVVLQSVSNGTLIVKAGSDARNLGRIDIDYSELRKKVTAVDWELIPVTAQIPEDERVNVVVEEYEGKLKAELDQPIGETSVVLNALQADNQTKETNLADFVADAYREETGADVVIFNGGSIRSNATYGPGQLTRRDILSILPFENPVVKLEVNGATIKQALEHGVSEIGRNVDGRFPQVSGLTFEFDPEKARGARVFNVLIQGKPLVASNLYTLATNNYVYSGGDGYNMLKDARVLIKPEEGQAESVAVLNAITKARKIAPQTEGRIKRAPVR